MAKIKDEKATKGSITGPGALGKDKKVVPHSKAPDHIEKSGITTPKGGHQKARKAIRQIQKKYTGRFSRTGAKPKPSPKHGFVPPGTEYAPGHHVPGVAE